MRQTGYMLFLILVVPFVVLAQQSTLHRVPQQFRTIQSAVNAARVGDTVLVDHGLYYENLRIGKNIVLAGRFIMDRDTGHVSRTIIDGSRPADPDRGSVIYIEGPTDTSAVVCGFTIQGGSGTRRTTLSGDPLYVGGGICLQDACATIRNNIIVRNKILGDRSSIINGGGIAAWIQRGTDSYSIIEHNIIQDNVLDGQVGMGAGIRFYQGGRISGNMISGNQVNARIHGWGGGIAITLASFMSVSVEGNYISRNMAPRAGGIAAGGLGEEIRIVNNIITRNIAEDLGGAYYFYGNGSMTPPYPSVLFAYNTVAENVAGTAGGAASVRLSSNDIVGNILWGNRPDQIQSVPLNRVQFNIVQGGYPGRGNLDAHPGFLKNDSLFHLDPDSPARGIFPGSMTFFGQPVLLPRTDYLGRPRESDTPFDIGAIQSYRSGSSPSNRGRELLEAALAKARWITVHLAEAGTDTIVTKTGHLALRGRVTPTVFINDVIAGAQSDGKTFDEIVLPPGENLLEVEIIRGRDLVRNEERTYRSLTNFRLKGIDQRLRMITKSEYTRYENLRPGSYTLELLSTDARGYHNPNNSVSIPVFVHPYWWQTWWFRVSIISIVIALISVLYRRELSRTKKEKHIQQAFSQQQIKSQEAERKRLAAELHDGLGQNLLLASNELQQYLQQQDGTKQGVEQAAQLLKESIRSAREMASNLHPHQLERLGFCAALFAMIEQAAHATGLKVQHHCDSVDHLLPKEAAVQLYRIIQEAVSNVVAHANAKEITLKISKGPREIELVLMDNGSGFDRERIPERGPGGADDGARGFGLTNMAERARILGGKLTIDSSPGRGTSVTVFVPLQKKHKWTIRRET